MKSSKHRLKAAIMSLMRSVARFLLRSGVGYQEFALIAKKAFVDTAVEGYGVRGRPTNISRVALLTGLTRKEVRNMRDLVIDPAMEKSDSRSLPAEVLHLWYTSRAYLNEDGKPIDLPFSGPCPSFETLVRDCARDIPHGAVRAELRRINAVGEGSNGYLRVLKREAIPLEPDEKLIEGLETGLIPLARTLAHNVEEISASRFQRAVTVPFISAESFGPVEEQIEKKLVLMTEDLDNFLVRFEADEKEDGRLSGVGIGVYYYREE
ncbi:MAG: DUF6502 family protein [Gammaproteobacteria bacterium]